MQLSTTPLLSQHPRIRRLGRVERAVQAIYFATGTVSMLLLLRFVLLALGANRDNAFTQFVLGLTYPFAGPFLTLFGGNPSVGDSVLQFPLLVAIVVYSLLGLFLARILRLTLAPTDPTGQAYQD